MNRRTSQNRRGDEHLVAQSPLASDNHQQPAATRPKAGHILWVNAGPWEHVSYDPTQFREMVRHTWVTVDLPAGTSTITLAKDHPDYPGETRPGTVDLDYIDVVLVH